MPSRRSDPNEDDDEARSNGKLSKDEAAAAVEAGGPDADAEALPGVWRLGLLRREGAKDSVGGGWEGDGGRGISPFEAGFSLIVRSENACVGGAVVEVPEAGGGGGEANGGTAPRSSSSSNSNNSSSSFWPAARFGRAHSASLARTCFSYHSLRLIHLSPQYFPLSLKSTTLRLLKSKRS